MFPSDLIILMALSMKDNDELIAMECSDTNLVLHVVRVSYTDDVGSHKYIYLCDRADRVIDSFNDMLEDGSISNLSIEEITK